MNSARCVALLPALALMLVGCVSNPPLETAHSCFEKYGLLVFDSSGDINCMSEAQYVLSRETDQGALVSSTNQ